MSVALLPLVSIPLVACLSPPGAAQRTFPAQGQVITAEQIRTLGVQNAWEVLRRYAVHLTFHEDLGGGALGIRRRGVASIARPAEVVVVIDGVRTQDVAILQGLRAEQVERIEILGGIDATTYYGIDSVVGVILIHTVGALKREEARARSSG